MLPLHDFMQGGHTRVPARRAYSCPRKECGELGEKTPGTAGCVWRRVESVWGQWGVSRQATVPRVMTLSRTSHQCPSC
eukprot:354900-Chlamydomonas_euryale.AAC.2